MSVTGRKMFRVLRWVGLAAVAPVLWACNARTLEKPNLTPEQTYGKTFQQTINRNVDMRMFTPTMAPGKRAEMLERWASAVGRA